MKRVARTACAFGIASLALAWIGLRVGGDAAEQAGRHLYWRAAALDRELSRPRAAARLLTWLGDSTIQFAPVASYPARLAQRFEPVGVETRIVAAVGLDAFDHYFLMGRALKLDPDVVVVIANLRLFGRGLQDPELTVLMAGLPASELGRASVLPLYDRGISVPMLLTTRILRFEPALALFYRFAGLREDFHNAPFWNAYAEAQPIEIASGERAFAKQFDTLFRSYDQPISESSPALRMLGAAVAMASRRGVVVGVIVCPIPYELLAERGLYAQDRFEGRIDALRQVVARSGGELLDLHRDLASDSFGDWSGHYTAAGAERLAARVEPWIAAALATDAGR